MRYEEKIEYKGYKIIIRPDEYAPNPRQEWDNFGHMVCWHNRYNLGDVDSRGKQKEWYHSDPETFEDWAHTEKRQGRTKDAPVKWVFSKESDIVVMLPLFLYDHSGITMRCSSFNDMWDSGQVGWTYCTRAEILEEFGGKKLTRDKIEKARKLLIAEVETYDMYLTGDVWGYEYFAPPPGYAYDEDEDEFLDDDGEPFVGYWDSDVDSCWGFYGYSYCLEEAKSQVDWHIQYTAEKELAAALQIENMHHKLFYELEGVGL